MAVHRAILTACIVASLISLATAISGTATYSDFAGPPSACYGFQNQGTMIAAASDELWDNGNACGRNYTIRCTGPTNPTVPQPCRSGSVTVTILDLCPACRATFDLSQEAFSTIADPAAGRIMIDYNQV